MHISCFMPFTDTCIFILNCRFVATLHLSEFIGHVFSQSTYSFSCLCHTLIFSLYFQCLYPHSIYYDDPGSGIFGVPTVLVLGSHSPHPYTMVNLTDECLVCSDFFTHWVFLPLHGSLYSSRHNNIKIRPIHNPTVASTHSSERQSCTSLT